jgi:hypothetical protein
MGSGVGTFREAEVKHLSASDRKELKRHTLQHLQNSKEIRALMKRNPKLFTKIKEVNTILRKKVNPVRKRMPKK